MNSLTVLVFNNIYSVWLKYYISHYSFSGVVYLENSNIYVAVKDGSVQRLCVKLDSERNISIELTGNSFRSEGVAFTGLVTSPNASLWGILES